jgi:hypothetical protein
MGLRLTLINGCFLQYVIVQNIIAWKIWLVEDADLIHIQPSSQFETGTSLKSLLSGIRK